MFRKIVCWFGNQFGLLGVLIGICVYLVLLILVITLILSAVVVVWGLIGFFPWLLLIPWVTLMIKSYKDSHQ